MSLHSLAEADSVAHASAQGGISPVPVPWAETRRAVENATRMGVKIMASRCGVTWGRRGGSSTVLNSAFKYLGKPEGWERPGAGVRHRLILPFKARLTGWESRNGFDMPDRLSQVPNAARQFAWDMSRSLVLSSSQARASHSACLLKNSSRVKLKGKRENLKLGLKGVQFDVGSTHIKSLDVGSLRGTTPTGICCHSRAMTFPESLILLRRRPLCSCVAGIKRRRAGPFE
jgi:hypothetical protein